jgi:hypothetical protein
VSVGDISKEYVEAVYNYLSVEKDIDTSLIHLYVDLKTIIDCISVGLAKGVWSVAKVV